MSKKAICKHCIHPCKKSPAPECEKFESFSIAKAIKERKHLLESKEDPKRLEFLTNKIMEFNGGTI